MKVLFVSSGNSKFGISPFIKSQGESLKKRGIELEYFSTKGKGIINYFKNIKFLRDYLRKNEFDIIHAHYGLFGIISCLAKKREKLIVSFMGDDLIGENKFDGSYTWFGKVLSFVNSRILTFCIDSIIVKSAEMGKLLSGKDSNIIPNGINIKRFLPMEIFYARKKINLNLEVKQIIFVANPERPEKNIKLARKAIELIGKSVKFKVLYNVKPGYLVYYFNSADLLLLTSFHEGSPNVIKEAMACNCPIVSTDVGDVRWIFGNTEGCYITSFEPKDVAGKIKQALNFAKKKGRTKGRKRIIELGLDSSSIAKKIISIYKEVIKR